MQVFSDMLKATEFIKKQQKQWQLQSKECRIGLEFTDSEYIEPFAAN